MLINTSVINEEFFGGPLEGQDFVDLMNPRIDKLINFLEEYKVEINEPNSIGNGEKSIKVENVYHYIINNLDLDTLSKSK